jgi:hypothetical protein
MEEMKSSFDNLMNYDEEIAMKRKWNRWRKQKIGNYMKLE